MRKGMLKGITAVLIMHVMIITTTVPTNAAKKVKLSKAKATLEVDATLTLKLENAPDTVSWKTSDKSVATVKKGKITAKAEGIATITASCAGKKYKCSVTVVDSNKEEATANAVKDGIPALADTAAFKVINCYKLEEYSYTSFVYVVEALKTTDATVKMTITNKNGDVLETGEDTISLTEGKQNYFNVSVESEYVDESNKFNLKTSTSKSFWTGDTDAVKVVRYNQSGDDLYITVKQVKENLGSFAQLKILLLNKGELVDAEECYYSVYAQDLTGKDSEALIELWVWGVDYTDIEFYFQDR